MSRFTHALPIWTLLGLTPAWAGGAGKPLSGQYLAGVRTEILHLRAEMLRLEDEVVRHPGAQKNRDLYGFTEAALAAVARLEKTVQPEASQEELLKQHGDLDNHV